MQASIDTTQQINERNEVRMNFRTKPRIKAAIQKAAALCGLDDSVYTMNAVYQAAQATIAAHERTQLQPADNAAFFAALDQAPPASPSLQAAFERHRDTVVSK
jgi:uncharacterized protein (DUF1778 family)